MSASFHHIIVVKTMTLTQPPEVLRMRFLSLADRRGLADLLECSLQQMNYWTEHASPSVRYRRFELRKSNGSKREIEVPHPVLLTLQRKLLQVLTAVYSPRAAVQGFVAERSILTNARMHVGRAWVLNLDLADFFTSIHFGRVRGIFRAKPYSLPDSVALAIAQLTCSNGRLPQGAATSPIISNIICAKMDGELRRLASEQGAIYSRYADDITFSVRRRSFPQAIAMISERKQGTLSATLSPALMSIITSNGFTINEAKTRIQSWRRSQRVTGLVVNQKPNVTRTFVRRTRAMLHAWQAHGLEKAQKRFEEDYAKVYRNKKTTPSFERRLRGNIAYIGQIRGRDDAVYIRLLKKFHDLIGKPLLGIPVAMTNNTTQRDVFICHASQDKTKIVQPIVRALEKLNISVWFDKAEIQWGDSLTNKISEGLASSRYVMVVVSSNFMAQNWPKQELAAAMNREISSGKTIVLPLMVGTDTEIASILSSLPLQAHKRYQKWQDDPDVVAAEVQKRLQAP